MSNPLYNKIRYCYVFGTSILGFYRGTEDYKFNYNIQLENYVKKQNYTDKKPTFFYYKCLLNGFGGSIFYVNPFTLWIMIPKEIYRLEVNLRNLEDEKKSRYYNDFY